ncbi:MAG: hypothetical protein O7J95_08980, partial [Planctomycetota bacterium]|nr:hypothetical protein [Planctomycetota bacterium]
MAIELRYCENCGDMIQSETAIALTDRFVCPKCQSRGKGPKDRRRGAAESPQPPARGGESTDLELFSEKTLLLHKDERLKAAATGGPIPQKPGASKSMMRRTRSSKAVKKTGSSQVIKRGTGSSKAVKRKGSSQVIKRGTGSSKSVKKTGSSASIKRKRTGPTQAVEKTGSSRVTQKAGFRDYAAAELETREDEPLKLVGSRAEPAPNAAGSEMPAQGATRLIFRCIHCKSVLSIRPVKATSRLTCPYCSHKIYITASGQRMDNPPSVVLRHGSSAVAKISPDAVHVDKGPERSRSVAVRAEAPAHSADDEMDPAEELRRAAAAKYPRDTEEPPGASGPPSPAAQSSEVKEAAESSPIDQQPLAAIVQKVMDVDDEFVDFPSGGDQDAAASSTTEKLPGTPNPGTLGSSGVREDGKGPGSQRVQRPGSHKIQRPASRDPASALGEPSEEASWNPRDAAEGEREEEREEEREAEREGEREEEREGEREGEREEEREGEREEEREEEREPPIATPSAGQAVGGAISSSSVSNALDLFAVPDSDFESTGVVESPTALETAPRNPRRVSERPQPGVVGKLSRRRPLEVDGPLDPEEESPPAGFFAKALWVLFLTLCLTAPTVVVSGLHRLSGGARDT